MNVADGMEFELDLVDEVIANNSDMVCYYYIFLLHCTSM